MTGAIQVGATIRLKSEGANALRDAVVLEIQEPCVIHGGTHKSYRVVDPIDEQEHPWCQWDVRLIAFPPPPPPEPAPEQQTAVASEELALPELPDGSA